MAKSTDLEANPFWTFEHDGWERAADAYGRTCGEATNQFVATLLDALLDTGKVSLLDVACGPGFLAAEAQQRGATVVGIDFSASVVHRARALHPELDIRSGDAHALAFGDATFDVVASNFGVLHFAEPERFFGEAYRVLRPGGRLGFTAWADVAGEVFSLIDGAITTLGVPISLPEGPPFFRFADASECRATLETAGYTSTTFATHTGSWEFDTPTALFDAIYDGTVRTAAVLRSQPADRLAAIRDALTDEVRRRGSQLPMSAHVVTAVKPATTAR